MVAEGQLRVNAARVSKAATQVGAGDVLTFALGMRVCVIRIVALGVRRGPAPEAQSLYDDLTPPPDPDAPEAARVGPRPTKRDRRAFDALRGEDGAQD